MAESSTRKLPDLLLATADQSDAIYRAARRGELEKIGPRLYSARVGDPAAQIIRDSRWQIAGLYAPAAVIGYRTAIEMQPTADGSVFFSGPTRRRVDLEGLKIRVLEGPGPLEGDAEFIGGLFKASTARALLESLKPSRARGGSPHSLESRVIEAYLDRLIQVSGENALTAVRGQARRLAPALDAAKELAILDRIAGKLLGTREGKVSSPHARARLASPPYDSDRLSLFERLHAALVQPMPVRPDTAPSGAPFRHAAFLDAYFSNYIEGTKLEIDEAREVVFDGRLISQRQADSHDVLGTFSLVGDPAFMSRSVRASNDRQDFLARLQQAHATIMAGRPEHAPGEFKERVNRAGESVFVRPELVRGTLMQGFTLAGSLELAFARAAAVMFVIAEVHPFADGNGRVARAFMNAELVAAGESRILVPTVYRDDYLGALRALTRQGNVEPFLRMLDYAQRISASIDYSDLDVAIAQLRACHAFDDDDAGTRLRLPPSAAR